MRKTEEKVYNEVIKPQIENLIKKSGDNWIAIALAYPNGNVCGFALTFAKSIITGDEIIRLTTFNMRDSFRNWSGKNYKLFIEMFKENGINPYLFFDERVLDEMAKKELTLAMEDKNTPSITI